LQKIIFDPKKKFVNLLVISVAPVFIILVYIYFRDKYEKEPIGLLLLSLFSGSLVAVAAILIENFLSTFNTYTETYRSAAYNAFVVASFSEETCKFLALYLLIWRNKNFNERFDGIVYAVFVSLGFAMIENLFYVYSGGMSTGVVRAFTAIPLHAFTGIFMGFYLGFARFQVGNKMANFILAFVIPFLIHGLYDFFLMTQQAIMIAVWLPFFIYLWIKSFRKMKTLSDLSKEDLI